LVAYSPAIMSALDPRASFPFRISLIIIVEVSYIDIVYIS
jgi:hypothetical protein